MKDENNIEKVAKREKMFSTLAKKEAKGALMRASTEKGAAKKDSEWEAKIDKKFVKIRENLAKKAKEKLGK